MLLLKYVIPQHSPVMCRLTLAIGSVVAAQFDPDRNILFYTVGWFTDMGMQVEHDVQHGDLVAFQS